MHYVPHEGADAVLYRVTAPDTIFSKPVPAIDRIAFPTSGLRIVDWIFDAKYNPHTSKPDDAMAATIDTYSLKIVLECVMKPGTCTDPEMQMPSPLTKLQAWFCQPQVIPPYLQGCFGLWFQGVKTLAHSPTALSGYKISNLVIRPNPDDALTQNVTIELEYSGDPAMHDGLRGVSR